MKFDLEIQDGIYFLNIYYIDTLKGKSCHPYGTIIFDVKRRTYYLIPVDKSELTNSFIPLMENLFLINLVPKNDYGYPIFNRGSRVGELSYSAENKLLDLFKKYDIQNPSKLNKDGKYYRLLQKYHRGYYPEDRMYDMR